MSALYDGLVSAALSNGVERYQVGPEVLADHDWRARHSRRGRLIVSSRTAYQERERWKAQTPDAWPVPDGELAKRYLGWCFEEQETHRKKVPYSRRALAGATMTPPQYFSGYTADRLADYVDIRSAFQQIRLPHSLDLRFDPARGVSTGRIRFLRAAEIMHDKRIARPLTGYILPTRLQALSNGKLVDSKKLWNKYEAPELVSYTYHVLHLVMAEAVQRFGILYGNADGYIVGREQSGELIEWLRREWSLEARIKYSGVAEIRSCNRYQIKGNPSHTIDPAEWERTVPTGPMSSIRAHDPALAAELKRHRYLALSQGLA